MGAHGPACGTCCRERAFGGLSKTRYKPIDHRSGTLSSGGGRFYQESPKTRCDQESTVSRRYGDKARASPYRMAQDFLYQFFGGRVSMEALFYCQANFARESSATLDGVLGPRHSKS